MQVCSRITFFKANNFQQRQNISTNSVGKSNDLSTLNYSNQSSQVKFTGLNLTKIKFLLLQRLKKAKISNPDLSGMASLKTVELEEKLLKQSRANSKMEEEINNAIIIGDKELETNLKNGLKAGNKKYSKLYNKYNELSELFKKMFS